MFSSNYDKFQLEVLKTHQCRSENDDTLRRPGVVTLNTGGRGMRTVFFLTAKPGLNQFRHVLGHVNTPEGRKERHVAISY